MKLFPLNVYFDQDSLATVISYNEVTKLAGVRIFVDTDAENTINVIMKESNYVYKFRPCGAGLYYLDMDVIGDTFFELTDSSDDVEPYTFLQSVATNIFLKQTMRWQIQIKHYIIRSCLDGRQCRHLRGILKTI